jgi:hypothetical protein
MIKKTFNIGFVEIEQYTPENKNFLEKLLKKYFKKVF